jgi:uncharacterized membrane protein
MRALRDAGTRYAGQYEVPTTEQRSVTLDNVTIHNGTTTAMRLDAPVAPGSVVVRGPGNVVVPRAFWDAWRQLHWDNQALLSGMLIAT